MLSFTPHSFQHKPHDGNNRPGFEEGDVFIGQLDPLTMDSLIRIWGMEVKRPHQIFCNLTAPEFRVGDNVVMQERTFVVMAPAQEYRHGLPTDHKAVLVEEIT